MLPATDSKTKKIHKKEFQAGKQEKKINYQTTVRSREEDVTTVKISKTVRMTMLRESAARDSAHH